ncbi:MAG: hypothetical protein AAF125_22275 [Chloroflexota bacterium]
MRKLQFSLILFAAMLLAAVPTFAQSDTITVDTGLFISEINNWLPMALTITAIGVGIAGGFALAGMVGRMIVNAFNGRI